MSTYEKIHGRSIQAVTTDPSETVAEGQVWYNTTSDTFKSIVALEAWFSGTPLSEARRLGGGFGINSASITFGGFGHKQALIKPLQKNIMDPVGYQAVH